MKIKYKANNVAPRRVSQKLTNHKANRYHYMTEHGFTYFWAWLISMFDFILILVWLNNEQKNERKQMPTMTLTKVQVRTSLQASILRNTKIEEDRIF